MHEKIHSRCGGVPRLRVLLALVAALLVIGVTAGCGSSQSAAGSASAAATTTTTGAATATSGDQTASSGVSDYAKYVGATNGGAADPSKSPIVIGWVNTQGGPNDVGPNASLGADFAVKYLNEKLGGIDGHAVKLLKCFTSTSEQQGQACGQEMVNNKAVKVIAIGAVSVGDQSLVATVDGQKPMVYSVAVGPADPTNKNGYALNGDTSHVNAPQAVYAAKVLHAKSIAVVHPDNPAFDASAQAEVAAAEKLGLKAKNVAWNPNATDLVAPLTAAGAQTADAILTVADPKGCVNLYKALQSLQIHTPVVSQPLCLNTDVVKAIGDLPQWTYGIAAQLASDMTDPTARAFAKVAKAYHEPAQYGEDVWINVTFHEMLTLFQWMNKVGADKLSAQTIAEQAKAFNGPLAFGPPTVQCGKYSDAPAVCNDQEKFYKYEGKGKFTPASGWLQSP
jgi:branched-chain amino acid transport system substrate-binding protein